MENYGIVERSGFLKVRIPTLDIRNAFNSAPWLDIMSTVYNKEIPSYLYRILEDYFSYRNLLYEIDDKEKKVPLLSWIPQSFWLNNIEILYGSLLQLILPENVEYLVFTNGIS